MRWGAVVASLVLASACESRFGAYVTIDGDGNQIKFDRVELYFAHATDAMSFATPNGPETGAVYARSFHDSDIFDVPPNADGTKATETTFWLPVNDKNMHLGTYVVAVAYDSAKAMPVGIGERFDLKVEPDVAYTYDLELEPWSAFNAVQWGDRAPSCLAWRKLRDGQPYAIAIVRPDDYDCDNTLATNDCNDLCPDGSTVCANTQALCTSTGCAIGCQRDLVCVPRVCVPAVACDPALCTEAGFESKLSCAIDKTASHIEIHLDVDEAGLPCATDLRFDPYNLGCAAPRVEYVQRPAGSDWAFSVQESSNMCSVRMESPTNQPFGDVHHVIISFDKGAIGARPSFMVGIQTRNVGPCAAEPYAVEMNGEISTCQ